MHNVGEEIAGLYLNVIKGCEFIQYNLYIPDTQGEIDVVAVNRRDRIVYICEVAVHLATGLQYVRDRQPDNINRFIKKFEKDIDYAEKYFSDHKRIYMLWSPIVKDQKRGSKHNQLRDIQDIAKYLKTTRNVDIEFVINEHFQEALASLRSFAAGRTEELKSPILRLMQIEERLSKYLKAKA